MNSGQIRKSKQTERFTVIPNGILEDKALSLKAIGLLCYLLRLPSDWTINKTSLHRHLKDGRDAVLAAFKELETAGYIKTEEVRDKGRFVGFNYEVSDNPKFEPLKSAETSEKPITEKPETENPTPDKPITGFPETVKPKSDKPKSENPELLNTNPTKDEVSTKDCKTKIPPPVNGNGSAVITGELFTEDPGTVPDPPRPEKKPSSLYQNFIAAFDTWFKQRNDEIPPVMNGREGTAAKSIIQHLTKTVEARAKKDGVILDDGTRSANVLNAWQFILLNWEKLDAFTQEKTRLVDINSNLQNIISKIKQNGNGKHQAGVNGNQTGKFSDNRSAGERYNSINKKYSSWDKDGV